MKKSLLLIILIISSQIWGQTDVRHSKYKTVFFDEDTETGGTAIADFDTSSLAINHTVGNEIEMLLYDDGGVNIFYLDSAGVVNVDAKVQHLGDADNYISWTADAVSQVVGNETMITITEDGSQDIYKIGDNGDIDIYLSGGDANALVVQGSSGNIGVKTATPASRFNVNGGTGSLSTGISFGDGDTGFYENTDDILYVAAGNSIAQSYFQLDVLRGLGDGEAYIVFAGASSTVPVYTISGDINTGIGHAAADQLSLIAGATEMLRLDQDNLLSFFPTSSVGVNTILPAKQFHVLGDVAIGDTATATSDRYIYFASDGSVTTEYMKFTENESDYSGFYFSDSISADGYIDYTKTFEGNAIAAIKKIKKEKDAAIDNKGFAELDHNSLVDAGALVSIDISYWERKSDKKQMHDGFQPVMSLEPICHDDSVLVEKCDSTFVTIDGSSYWEYINCYKDTIYCTYPSYGDSLNYIDNFKYVKKTRQARNISALISVLVKANQELASRIEYLEKAIKP